MMRMDNSVRRTKTATNLHDEMSFVKTGNLRQVLRRVNGDLRGLRVASSPGCYILEAYANRQDQCRVLTALYGQISSYP